MEKEMKQGVETKTALEELLRENARLRGDLQTIAMRISHDLRTPLGGIISAGEAMKEILAETDPSSVQLATSLLDSTDELSQIIKKVSFLIKSTLNPLPLEKTEMGKSVFAALQCLENRILKQKASVVEPNNWPEVKGVSSWLEIIWWNLMTNALQHAGEAPRIELGWDKGFQEIRFWISDSGKNIPVNLRGKLFQSFDSLHELDSSRGLGLSLVQRLVELQGGHCGYETNPRGNALFFFTLPAIAA